MISLLNSIDVSVSPPGYSESSESSVGILEPMSGLDVGLVLISGLEKLSVEFEGFNVGFGGFAVGFGGLAVGLGGFSVVTEP